MPQYIIAYLGGDQPSSPEEGQQHFAKYLEWLTSLGDSAVSPANPLKDTNTVGPDGTVTAGGSTSMSGYTIVDVDSMEAALTIAQACPDVQMIRAHIGLSALPTAKPQCEYSRRSPPIGDPNHTGTD